MERMSSSSSFFTNGATSTTLNSGDDTADIYSRFRTQVDSFSRSDQARNELMNRLLINNTQLHDEVSELKSDLDNERRSRRHLQAEARTHQVEIERALAAAKIDNDPFCLALIDGDGCIFQDRLLKAAADGGAEAAHLLTQEITQLLRDKGLGSGCTIMVQIYMSLEDLARKLAYVGILNTAGELKAFEQSFCNAQSLFSIVDVGRGKERADHKIKEMFRLFVNNSHCKHVIFGGCHDNGYIPNLAPFSKNPSVADRLTLLETTPAEYQYRSSLGFAIRRFPSVFRDTPLPERRQISPAHVYTQPLMSPAANTFVPNNGNVFSSSPSPAARDPTPPSIVQSPVGTGRPLAAVPNGAPAAPKTYASIGGALDSKTVDVKSTTKPNKKFILYNAVGNRIDIPLSKPDSVSENRFKSRVATTGKLCNNHHLRGQCYKGSDCEYSHDPPLSEGEKNAFRFRVRTTMCTKGTGCEDFGCYLGHNCPFGAGKCTKGDCSFTALHGIDLMPKQKYYEDGEVDILRT